MRSVRAACCAAAMALLIAPAMRADEFNKQTYLTFSGPVQVPGAALPAGTYMFKLADPESSRRVIQIWDQEGTKLYTTLLSIPDQLMDAKSEPVVLFTERPAGEPQAIKAWFYPSDRYGYEFVYPKDQAMKIAQATHAPVLAHDETIAADADVATRAGAKVGRIDEKGQFDESRAARADESTARAPSSSSQAAAATAPEPDSAAAATPAPADQDAPAPAAPAPGSATQPSANRTGAAAAPAGTLAPADTAAPSTTARNQDTPVARAPAATTGDSASTPATAGTSGQLPATASSWPLVQLFAVLSLLAALALHQMRTRLSVRA